MKCGGGIGWHSVGLRGFILSHLVLVTEKQLGRVSAVDVTGVEVDEGWESLSTALGVVGVLVKGVM